MYIKIENENFVREGDISVESVIKIFELIFGSVPSVDSSENDDHEDSKI